MCDKCVKKNVCKLCDGSNIQGCIEFYKPHEDILEDILHQMKSIKEAENQIYKGAS